MPLNDIAIFYHIWSPDNTDLWKLIVDEQLKRLLKSELPQHGKVYCTISGAQASKIQKYVSLYSFVEILEISESDEKYEGLTLEKLSEYSTSNPNIDACLYFHTKGISHMSGQSSLCKVPGIDNDRMFRAINSWRHELEWGVIDKWQSALLKLEHVDVVGVNYCPNPWPHMSGNFWWARTDYIRNLPHPTLGNFNDQRDFGNIDRMKYEKWIGLNSPSCHSFFNLPNGVENYGISPDLTPQAFEPQFFWPYRDDIEPYFRSFLKNNID